MPDELNATNSILLVFRVFYKRPMVIDSLNLKLRQIVRFSSNVILDEMTAECYLLFGFFFLIAQLEERALYHVQIVTSHFLITHQKERPLY